jgi:hypothetical protein
VDAEFDDVADMVGGGGLGGELPSAVLRGYSADIGLVKGDGSGGGRGDTGREPAAGISFSGDTAAWTGLSYRDSTWLSSGPHRQRSDRSKAMLSSRSVAKAHSGAPV